MPALASSPSVHTCVVIDRREAGPGIVVLLLDAPELARSARPGQFVMVTPPGGERVATALGIYEAEGARISLMIVECGYRDARTFEYRGRRRARAISARSETAFFSTANCATSRSSRAASGLAPLLLPARALRARGIAVDLYYGARTAAALVDAEKFEALGVRVTPATDDGSRGHHGYVTDALLRGGRAPRAICSPAARRRCCARSRASRNALGVRAQLSLEETFACGVGACWGCVVPLDRA